MRRKNTCIFTTIVILLLLVGQMNWANAQNSADLKINEILVNNESNCIDDYGCHSSWIEIVNVSNNPIDIGGYYLTNDNNNPTKYWIPVGDQKTFLRPNSYLIFWADNKPERGILHANFDLKDSKSIALYGADGIKLIDKIDIELPQKTDVTYGRLNTESNECVFLDKSTPGTINNITRKAASVKPSEKVDMSGIINLAIFIAIAFAVIIIILIFRKIRLVPPVAI